VTAESQGGVQLDDSDFRPPPLVPGRSCGTCNLCCKVFSIKEINKPAGQWCSHCERGGRGCTIHDRRPRSCREFFCSWLIDPNLGPEWKPEVARFVLSADPNYQALTLMADPGMPLAWKRQPYYSVLKQFSEVFFRLDQKVLVNLKGHITVILPDREVPLGIIVPGEDIVLWREGPGYRAMLRRDFELAKRTGSLGPGSM
jgi:hypothetical protein